MGAGVGVDNINMGVIMSGKDTKGGHVANNSGDDCDRNNFDGEDRRGWGGLVDSEEVSDDNTHSR